MDWNKTEGTSPSVIKLTRLSSHKKVSSKRLWETKKEIGNQKTTGKEIQYRNLLRNSLNKNCTLLWKMRKLFKLSLHRRKLNLEIMPRQLYEEIRYIKWFSLGRLLIIVFTVKIFPELTAYTLSFYLWVYFILQILYPVQSQTFGLQIT